MSGAIDKHSFEEAYAETIIGNDFFEHPSYYKVYKERYYKTLESIVSAMNGRPVRSLLEIGGGQVSLLCRSIYGTRCDVYDASRQYAHAVERHGVGFGVCDILREDILSKVAVSSYDVVVLCEVVEHILKPLHLVLEPFAAALKPGGLLFLTTPNFNRLRNCVRILSGRRIACNWFYPEKGQTLGHVLEFEYDHLKWQLERTGLTGVQVNYAQLTNAGASTKAYLLRKLASPLMLRKRWRDNLIAYGYRSGEKAVPE